MSGRQQGLPHRSGPILAGTVRPRCFVRLFGSAEDCRGLAFHVKHSSGSEDERRTARTMATAELVRPSLPCRTTGTRMQPRSAPHCRALPVETADHGEADPAPGRERHYLRPASPNRADASTVTPMLKWSERFVADSGSLDQDGEGLLGHHAANALRSPAASSRFLRSALFRPL